MSSSSGIICILCNDEIHHDPKAIQQHVSSFHPSFSDLSSFTVHILSVHVAPDDDVAGSIIPPRMRTRNAGWSVAESLGGGTGVRVGRGGRGRRPREGNDKGVDDLNGQGNDQGMGANEGNLLPAMLAQVGNQGNVGNPNGNVSNENIQENVRNVLVNGNQVGCSYKEFLACNPKEYDGKGGVVVLTRWIEKMENI
ncbi:hypothetical protein Tco_0143833 [Tanacetum coccineum]